MNGVEAFISVHDYDWNAVYYFKDNNINKEFFNFINSRTKIVFTESWDDFD